MSVTFAIARTLGVPALWETLFGTLFGLAPGPFTWMVGLVAHLLLSGLIGLAYAWGFTRITEVADWRAGLPFALVHAAIAGTILGGLLPAVHPLVPEVIRAPGLFMSNLGPYGILFFVIAHMSYGAVIGAIHRRVPGN